MSNKSRIASWIPGLHQDTGDIYSYVLTRKTVNAIGDLVIAFYDCDDVWTDKQNVIVKRDPLKFTHTWMKYDDNWVILGGMAGSR